jgi:hypothetical protein
MEINVSYCFNFAQVGVEVCARIEVTSVKENVRGGEAVTPKEKQFGHEDGYDIVLKTQVIRVQDDAVIAEGAHSIWIPSSVF